VKRARGACFVAVCRYFAPQWQLKAWIASGALRPNAVDQPMAQFHAPGYHLTPQEQARALYLLTDAALPFAEFSKLPEVQRAVRASAERAATPKTNHT
jgi:hypothetical protein